MLMEVFRNINATIGIFVVSLFLMKKKNDLIKKYQKIIYSIVLIYLFVLLNNFTIPKYNKDDYEIYDNRYFSSVKKVNKEIKKYYENLESVICSMDNISLVNITNDFAIPYICENQFIKSKSSMPKLFLKTSKFNEYNRIFNNHFLHKEEVLISPKKIFSNNLKLIIELKSPHEPKEWFGDLYIYKSN